MTKMEKSLMTSSKFNLGTPMIKKYYRLVGDILCTSLGTIHLVSFIYFLQISNSGAFALNFLMLVEVLSFKFKNNIILFSTNEIYDHAYFLLTRLQ